ncbi:phosphopantetheine-binding protein [Streptomyces stramineus]
MSEHDERIGRLSEAQRAVLARWVTDLDDLRTDGTDDWEADDGPGTAAVAYRPPGTAAERALADIWQEVLETDRIGADDDYFAAGGDSIHAIVIVAKARHAGFAVSAQDLFEGRTLAAVAERAVPLAATGPAAESAVEPAVEPAPATAEYGLAPMQEGMLYHSLGGSTPGAYVVQVCCRLTGELDERAFHTAWQTVLTANPALCASFRWDEGTSRPRSSTRPPASPYARPTGAPGPRPNGTPASPGSSTRTGSGASTSPAPR